MATACEIIFDIGFRWEVCLNNRLRVRWSRHTKSNCRKNPEQSLATMVFDMYEPVFELVRIRGGRFRQLCQDQRV